MLGFLTNLFTAFANTFLIYLPAWIAGTMLGIVVSFIIWLFPPALARWSYVFLTGISFVPVTILIPYLIWSFGMPSFIYPLLMIPVTLITAASNVEAFAHANHHRQTLQVNYGMATMPYFWSIVFREALPALKSTARQTLSLCFAIFIAVDFFIGTWKGLGSTAAFYYQRVGLMEGAHLYLLLVIVATSFIGSAQVWLNDRAFARAVEFRRHY
jgi:ABC-type nitrate/sulfonate/bicarbonate transport system permease component